MINKCVIGLIITCASSISFAELPKGEATYTILKPAAERGDIPAQYSLGYLYEKGAGVKQNFQQSTYWYTQAANHDHMEASFRLSILYLHPNNKKLRDPNKALRWLEKAAEKGHLQAQYTIGKRYHEGNGINKNTKLGLQWLEAAKEAGHLEAENYLAKIGREAKTKTSPRVVKSRRANIRKGPGREHKVLIMLRRGDKVELYPGKGYWARVKVNITGAEGWVARHLLKKP